MTKHSAVSVGELVALPGQKREGYCKVDLGPVTVELPVVVIHGAKPGPTLTVTAGIHGGEYVPLVAVRRFVNDLNPDELQGVVIACLQASPIAFADRVAYLNPVDGRNLNRSFPGRSDGTPTERLAAWLWDNLISRSDYYVDCHCGDLTEQLDPFVGIWSPSEAQPDPKSLGMSKCFKVNRRMYMRSNGTTIQSASQAGIPSVLVEVGGEGRWSEEEVAIVRQGLHRVLGEAGITPQKGSVDTPELTTFQAAKPNLSEHAGLWFPKVEAGDVVKAGQNLGSVEDPFGAELQAIEAAESGTVGYVLSSLAVNQGELVVALATQISE